MKRFLSCFLIIVLLLLLVSCSKGAKQSESTTESAAVSEKTVTGNTVDLTKISSTLVYTELYNMMTGPDKYDGKTVIMKGTYKIYEGGGRNYHVCEVMDATACCTQGLEFVLKDGEEYPEFDEKSPKEIEISGTFKEYDDNGQNNFRLENAEIVA